ncbi:hypothetical protein [Sphaerisporangium sp. NPDC051011]|uniref:hypothetical protein n=1 Tax=Sphaerisporangium sp. NPDC051011 TaxID=3155792 RepID=UPI0033D95088
MFDRTRETDCGPVPGDRYASPSATGKERYVAVVVRYLVEFDFSIDSAGNYGWGWTCRVAKATPVTEAASTG